MKLSFRNGIVSGVPQFTRSTDSVTFTTSSTSCTMIDGTKNYHVQFSGSHSIGIPSGSTEGVFFVDVDTRTAAVTFGFTSGKLVLTSPNPPANTSDMWFDHSTNQIKRYRTQTWVPCFRVILADMVAGIITSRQAGVSQVGLQVPCFSGRIMFDPSYSPIKLRDGSFLTSETEIFSDQTAVRVGRLEPEITQSTATETIGDYTVVKINNTDRAPARYDDIGMYLLGFVEKGCVTGGDFFYLLSGRVSNPAWNFAVGVPVWVDDFGGITINDAHVANPLRKPRPPVGVTISANEIFFSYNQVLPIEGGFVVQTPNEIATIDELGSVYLATPADQHLLPIVVGTNDPRLTDSRAPTPHSHVASELEIIASDIPVTPSGALIHSSVQTSLDLLEAQKLNLLTGGTMQAPLLLADDPAQDLEAATKRYVDANTTAHTQFVHRAGDIMEVGASIALGRDPIGIMDAVPNLYMESRISDVVRLSGGNMIGQLVSRNALTIDGQGNHSYDYIADEFVNRNFVEDSVAVVQANLDSHTHDYLSLQSGGTVHGPIQLTVTPASPIDAVTVEWVGNYVADALTNFGNGNIQIPPMPYDYHSFVADVDAKMNAGTYLFKAKTGRTLIMSTLTVSDSVTHSDTPASATTIFLMYVDGVAKMRFTYDPFVNSVSAETLTDLPDTIPKGSIITIEGVVDGNVGGVGVSGLSNVQFTLAFEYPAVDIVPA